MAWNNQEKYVALIMQCKLNRCTTHGAPHKDCPLYQHTMTKEQGHFTKQRCSKGEWGEGR